MDSNPRIASAAIIRPPASKSKPRTRPSYWRKTFWFVPSRSIRRMVPLVIAA